MFSYTSAIRESVVCVSVRTKLNDLKGRGNAAYLDMD